MLTKAEKYGQPEPPDAKVAYTTDCPPSQYPPGRICADTECDTILSRYNKYRVCYVHRDAHTREKQLKRARHLTNAAVLQIRTRYAAGERIRDLAREYNVHYQLMWNVVHYVTYKEMSI